MRVRNKDCYVCNDPKQVLYRCRYQDLKDWVFLCGKCLTDVKSSGHGKNDLLERRKGLFGNDLPTPNLEIEGNQRNPRKKHIYWQTRFHSYLFVYEFNTCA